MSTICNKCGYRLDYDGDCLACENQALVIKLNERKRKSGCMKINFRKIPEGWFLYSLIHVHDEIRFSNRIHEPLHWECKFQIEEGGSLVCEKGNTPKEAFDKAVRAALNRGQ